ncbi:hypothetical protein [Bacillus mycoides]|uniref:hypothetical protein n=1 Tax=Bacillus cereus group TaxID=86661 RepID=UPI0001A09D49|nr:hypothetical protein [Bacillus mycoides]EEL49685.1 hypothetical protein bcere0022_30260 [Bacillus cereus Rock3-44]
MAGAHVITDVDSNKITYVPISVAGATGIPKDIAGLLVANRTHPYAGYQHEFYHGCNNNRLYYRNTKSTGELLNWEKITRKEDTKVINCTFGNVTVQWHLDYDIVVAATTGDFVMLSPVNGKMLDDVNFTSFINDQGKVIVRAINYTVANKDFRISVIFLKKYGFE